MGGAILRAADFVESFGITELTEALYVRATIFDINQTAQRVSRKSISIVDFGLKEWCLRTRLRLTGILGGKVAAISSPCVGRFLSRLRHRSQVLSSLMSSTTDLKRWVQAQYHNFGINNKGHFIGKEPFKKLLIDRYPTDNGRRVPILEIRQLVNR